jgi:hypothetical protein
MKTLKERLWRIENRCKKQKHTPKTNRMGITFCTDCGMLIK